MREGEEMRQGNGGGRGRECGREKGRSPQCVKPCCVMYLVYNASKCILYSQYTDSLL